MSCSAANRRRSRRRLVTVGLAAAVAVSMAGCGSTVANRSGGAPTGPVDAAGGLTGGFGSVTSASPGDSPNSGAGLTVPSDTSRSSLSGSGPTGVLPPSGQSQARASVQGPQGAVTARTITIGFIYPTRTEALSAFGVSGVSTGDPKAQAQAIVAELNRRGGIAGRRIVPLFYGMDTEQYFTNPDPQFQAACAYFTEDNKVFAVVSYLNAEQAGSSGFYHCLAKRQTVFVDDASGITAAEYRELGPYFYKPSGFLAERATATYVGGLAAMSWITPQTKIGLFYVSTSQTESLVKHVIEPMLAQRGMSLTAKGSTATGPAGINDIPGIVLQFRQKGVTHVLTMTNPIFFMQQAESQHYYPKYGLSSSFSPATTQTLAPRDQLVGAGSVGWSPVDDVDQAHDPGPVSTNQTYCLKLMAAAGQDTSNRTVQMYMALLCDPMFFLQAALSGASGPLGPAVLADGAYGLGRSFQSALTFGTYLQRGRPDGAGSYRPSLFDNACSCFVYTGPVRPSIEPPAA